jgi:hypothetical protein
VLLGCSDLSEGEDGVVALEVTAPAGGAVEVGDTVQYTARALNIQGEEVAAEIRWATPDTANVSVDSLSGLVAGKAGATVARVQASTGSLLSPLNLISVLARADTLILVSPDTMTVDLLLGSSTPALEARLESYDPAGPLSGATIYEIVDPVTSPATGPSADGRVLIDTHYRSGGTPPRRWLERRGGRDRAGQCDRRGVRVPVSRHRGRARIGPAHTRAICESVIPPWRPR